MVTKWLKLPLVAKKLQESEYFSWRLKKNQKTQWWKQRHLLYSEKCLFNIKNFFASSHITLFSFWKSKRVDLPECHHIRLRNVSIEVLSWKLPPWALGVPEEKSLQRTWNIYNSEQWCVDNCIILTFDFKNGQKYLM